MTLTVSELKDLILWAKKEKVAVIKIGDVQFELSQLALVSDMPDFSGQSEAKDLSVPASSPRLPNGNQQVNEDDDDLYYSSR
jgi:hypothetical protein